MKGGLTEEERKKILDYVDNEQKLKDKTEKRKARVNSLFFSDEDREQFGFSPDVLDFMVTSANEYLKDITVQHQHLGDMEDYIKVDDTWLKMALLMYETQRLTNQNERLKPFKEKNVSEYIKQAVEQGIERLHIIKKAGEIVCTFLEIEADEFMYFRD